jgi:hypothetical protein
MNGIRHPDFGIDDGFYHQFLGIIGKVYQVTGPGGIVVYHVIVGFIDPFAGIQGLIYVIAIAINIIIPGHGELQILKPPRIGAALHMNGIYPVQTVILENLEGYVYLHDIPGKGVAPVLEGNRMAYTVLHVETILKIYGSACFGPGGGIYIFGGFMNICGIFRHVGSEYRFQGVGSGVWPVPVGYKFYGCGRHRPGKVVYHVGIFTTPQHKRSQKD